MVPDPHETIAAIASPTGPALRGIVRLSGRDVVQCLASCFVCESHSDHWQELDAASLLTGRFQAQHSISCSVYLWPTARSYTRQPTAEIHLVGSAPLLEEVLETVCLHGARLAQPGEFTLRAFLAGRLDLTQAEAVLGLIDAQDEQDFEVSLQQLAGGLSSPLSAIREQLLAILAELEAGLDFVDEDIEFISAQQLHDDLATIGEKVATVIDQIDSRALTGELPRVALVGPPNAGKSSLFNAIADRYGSENAQTRAIVSAHQGTTRDYLTVQIDLNGVICELVDTAGLEDVPDQSIAGIAQEQTARQHQSARLLVMCEDQAERFLQVSPGDDQLPVLTKSDLVAQTPPETLACSSYTGAGLPELCAAIRTRLLSSLEDSPPSPGTTAIRCAESLKSAQEFLQQAHTMASQPGNEELIATDVRAALHEIGQVVGAVYTDDILDRIFGQFCIGK